MKKDSKFFLRIIYTAVLLVLMFSLLFSTYNILNKPIQSNYSYLYQLAENNRVFDVKVSDKQITFKDEANNKYIIYRIASDGIIDKLHLYSQPYILEPSNSPNTIFYVSIIAVGAIAYYLYNRNSSSDEDNNIKSTKRIDRDFSRQQQTRDYFTVDMPRKRKTTMYSQMSLEDMLLQSDAISPQEIADNNTDPLKKFTVRDTNRELYMPQNLDVDDDKFTLVESDVDRMLKSKSREEWNNYYRQQMIDAGLSDGIVQESKGSYNKEKESHPVVESKLKNKVRQGPSRVGRLRQKSSGQTIIDQPGAIIKQALKQEGFNED